MIVRSATRILVVLAASAVLAQSAQLPGTTASEPILNRPGLTPRSAAVANKNPDPQGLVAMRERVAAMEGTLSKMRGVLKQMHAKDHATDSLAKANLDMWDLMVGQLDKDLLELRQTLSAREDLEARRAAMYRQADVKNAAAVQAARAAQAARFAGAQKNATGTPTPAPTAQSAEPSPGAQTAPRQPAPAPATNNPASPN